jgi:PadR family transcriptional regulator PadR
MLYLDNDMDGIVDRSERAAERARRYADGLSTQFKKGLLGYCVLWACEEATYTSEVIEQLNLAELDVAEGTIYPLLTRLQRDGLLEYTWQENDQGPPRKYYLVTEYGRAVRAALAGAVKMFNKAIKTLERSGDE